MEGTGRVVDEDLGQVDPQNDQQAINCKVTSIEISRFQRHGKLATKITVLKIVELPLLLIMYMVTCHL